MRKVFTSGMLVLLLAGLFCINNGCNKKDAGPTGPAIDTPHIQYAGTQTLATSEGQTVNFNSITTNATSYLWNFGDGDTAMTPNATHVYQDSGDFTVIFIPYNAVGAGSKSTCKVAVSNPGWWTFKSVRYYNTGGFGTGYGTGNWTMSGSSNLPDSIATLTIWFYSALPNGPGIYFVTNGTLTAQNQVYVTYQVNGYMTNPPFQSTGGNGRQIVTIYNSGGTLALAANGIELANTVNQADSTPVTFNLIAY